MYIDLAEKCRVMPKVLASPLPLIFLSRSLQTNGFLAFTTLVGIWGGSDTPALGGRDLGNNEDKSINKLQRDTRLTRTQEAQTRFRHAFKLKYN